MSAAFYSMAMASSQRARFLAILPKGGITMKLDENPVTSNT